MTHISGPCAVIGGGGHGRVIVECLMLEGQYSPLMVVDPLLDRALMPDLPVVDDFEAVLQAGVRSFVIGVGGRGGNPVRSRLFAEAVAAGLSPVSSVHPSAVVSPSAEIGAGSVVLAGAVVGVGARVGVNSIINTGARVDHDCLLGENVHVAPGAVICGGVQIGAGTHVGPAAVIVERLTVGPGAVVGAGSVVLREVDPGLRVAGTPSRPIGRPEK